jgi:excisionase family DNA binding protein
MTPAEAVVERGPVAAAPEERERLKLLDRALAEVPASRSAVLTGPEGEQLEVPESVYRVLVQIVHEMARGNAVSVVPVHAQLTTQQAAELLGVSRTHVVSLLDAGEIAYTKPGKHRRIRLADLLDYSGRHTVERHEALREMTREAERLGLEF